MTPQQIKTRYEKKFIDNEYMLKKRASISDLSFRVLKVYYSEKNFHLDNKSFETNLNLRNESGEYNLLAELLADRNNIPFIFVKFKGENKASISERSDYGYGCILSIYEKIKDRLKAENICVSDTTVRPRRDKFLFDYDCVNGLTEHTGHGIPTIVEKYGEGVFEIGNNYIKCTIPFDEEVVRQINDKNISYDVVINASFSNTEKKVIKVLIENPNIKSSEIATKLGVTKRTIERSLKSLKEKEIIERVGAKHDESWAVVR